jgi:hypothetical protein
MLVPFPSRKLQIVIPTTPGAQGAHGALAMQSAVDERRDRCAQAIASELTPAWLEGFLEGLQAPPESCPNMGHGHDYALGWLTARYAPHLAEQVLPPALVPLALLNGF